VIRKRGAAVAALLLIQAALGFGTARADGGAALRIAVGIPPMASFVSRIGGDLVEVTAMLPPGANPHVYEPKPRDLAALSKVRAYLALGATFEDAWLKRFRSVNPDMPVVFVDRGIGRLSMTPRGPDESHDHGYTGETGRDGSTLADPHVWLSPPNALLIARNIFAALCELAPEKEPAFERGYRSLMTDILDLDVVLSNLFRGGAGKRFLVFHPAWGYFAQAYGLEQIAVEAEGKEPKPAELARLITFAREQGIRVVFVQPQYSRKSAETIADAIGGGVVAADPLAEDWLGNMRTVASNIADALR